MAPIPSRNRSVSSSHGSTAKRPRTYPSADHAGVIVKKNFDCHFPGCGKAFSRSEHLHRHALNHEDGGNTCERCSAHFRRRDLLDRHMARHRGKDDEAGGEGLGVLATRKRLWRDGMGRIINAQRPSCIKAANLNIVSIDTQPIRRRASAPRANKPKTTDQYATLPSPPMSSQVRSLSPYSHVHPSTCSLPRPRFLPSSPPAPARASDHSPLNPWLSTTTTLSLPLPSPPMSEASLSSSSRTQPSYNHALAHAHKPPLFDEPSHSSWPMLHHGASSPLDSTLPPPPSQQVYLGPANPWSTMPNPHPHSQSCQTFMDSAGPHEPSHYPDAPGKAEMGLFKSGMNVSPYPDEKAELGIFKSELNVSVPLDIGMYDWNGGQPQAWANGSVGMMSRVRPERYESPAGTSSEEKKDGGLGLGIMDRRLGRGC